MTTHPYRFHLAMASCFYEFIKLSNITSAVVSLLYLGLREYDLFIWLDSARLVFDIQIVSTKHEIILISISGTLV